MKTFLEEYGVIIVAVIAVAALILFATNYSKTGTDGMGNTFNTFQTQADGAVNTSTNTGE